MGHQTGTFPAASSQTVRAPPLRAYPCRQWLHGPVLNLLHGLLQSHVGSYPAASSQTVGAKCVQLEQSSLSEFKPSFLCTGRTANSSKTQPESHSAGHQHMSTCTLGRILVDNGLLHGPVLN